MLLHVLWRSAALQHFSMPVFTMRDRNTLNANRCSTTNTHYPRLWCCSKWPAERDSGFHSNIAPRLLALGISPTRPQSVASCKAVFIRRGCCSLQGSLTVCHSVVGSISHALNAPCSANVGRWLLTGGLLPSQPPQRRTWWKRMFGQRTWGVPGFAPSVTQAAASALDFKAQFERAKVTCQKLSAALLFHELTMLTLCCC